MPLYPGMQDTAPSPTAPSTHLPHCVKSKTYASCLFTLYQIHLSLAKGLPVALVLLDLSAAFDTINHTTLPDCLRSWFGVCGTAWEWFSSYLSDRCQAVKIGSILSEFKELLFGVPQGSVLGPLLFSLYTTPLTKIISKYPGIKFHFYADDIQLFVNISPESASASLKKS